MDGRARAYKMMSNFEYKYNENAQENSNILNILLMVQANIITRICYRNQIFSPQVVCAKHQKEKNDNKKYCCAIKCYASSCAAAVNIFSMFGVYINVVVGT